VQSVAMGAKRYESLDGMRGICALIVTAYHSAYALNTAHFPDSGWLSVDMFFVLSGFVIALTYEDRLKAGFSFSDFLRARAKRLVPIQTIGTVICAASLLPLLWTGQYSFMPFVFATTAAVFLIPISLTPLASYFPDWRGIFPINSPIWSLQGEWVINAIYGRLLFSWPMRALLAAAIVSATFVLALAFSGLGWASTEAGLGRSALGFIIGIIVYRVHRQPAFQRLPAIGPGVIYALWFFLSCTPQTGGHPLLRAIGAAVISGLLVALLVRNDRSMPFLVRKAGQLSYPLYASHFAIVNLAMYIWPATTRKNPMWAIPMVAAALLLAHLVDHIASTMHMRANLAPRPRSPQCQTEPQ
jgi:peptidoglycan/LPS O-acetylase OafA/YrhL